MSASLVGSEMCIRDRIRCQRFPAPPLRGGWKTLTAAYGADSGLQRLSVSYTHLTLPTICSV
eukprot:12409532-Alexandrium_andersonii.AAC.1